MYCEPRREGLGKVERLMEPVGVAVDDYIACHRRPAARELEYFSRVIRADEDAVSRAALAQLPNGNRHPHQRRIPRAALEESRRRLLANLPLLQKARTWSRTRALGRCLPKLSHASSSPW